MKTPSSLRDAKQQGITVEQARAAFFYDPETGVLRWKLPTKSRRKHGAICGTVSSYGYRQVVWNGQMFMAHRLAWFITHGEWPSEDLDHINGNRDDNRLENLRPASRWQNSANGKLRSTNSSGFKGVSWDADRGQWTALIYHGGKRKRLGRFATKEEASTAYLRAAAEIFGDFARAT